DNVISNSCGSLDCSAVSVSGDGPALTVTWNMTAGQALAGVNRLFVRARDLSGLDTGYQQTSGATWTVNGSRPPTTAADATSVTSAAGQPHAFTATYSDPDGWANLGWVHLRLNTYLPTLLEAIYNVATNKLYLR